MRSDEIINCDATEKITWGKDAFLQFSIPRGWNLLAKLVPTHLPPITSVETELQNALLNPISAPPLPELARRKNKIAIVVDDISRPTPAHLLMGKILEHITSADVHPNSVVIIPGLGVHRPMTQEEMELKVGKENLSRVKWENHDCRDQNKLVCLGRTKRGTRTFVNKTVTDADLVILVGTIEPHVHAGFGGGFKNILPGVAGAETIAKNHAICAHPKYYSMLGTPPEENPMRQDIEEAGRMLRGKTFAVNTILNANTEIVRIVAGDPVAAHREGIKTASQIFGAKIPSQADIVITDSYPMDLDLRQGVKSVANTLFAAKPGGIIIAALKCDEGLGSIRVPKIKLPSSPTIAKLIAALMAVLITKIAPPGISPEERFSAYFLLKAVMRNRIFLYAPSIADEIDGKIPLIRVFKNFTDAIHTAHLIKPRANILIFPNGGVTYPLSSQIHH